MIKRIVTLSISAVLLVFCLVFTSVTNRTVIAGPGNGTDEKVETLEEFIEVLEYLTQKSSGNSVASSKLIATLSAQAPEAVSSKASSNHESATIHISTHSGSSYSSSNSSYTSGMSSSSMSIDRELTLYINEDCTYYESTGTVSSATSGTYNSTYKTSSAFMNFDMCIYHCEDESYILINELIFADDSESRQIRKEYAGCWIEMPFEFVEGLVDIDTDNREVLASIGAIIEFLIENEEADEDDNKISLSGSEWERICKKLDQSNPFSLLGGDDMSFDVDLSAPTRPYISLYSYQDASDDYDAVSVHSTAKNDIKITMKNIDNTEIKFNDRLVDVSVSDADDFEDLFLTHEIDKEDD